MDRRYEYPDPTPIEVPIANREMTLQEMVAAYVKQQVFLHDRGVEAPESIEEAEDFDIDEDYDPPSPYEFHAMVAQEFDARKAQADAKQAVKRFVAHNRPKPPSAKPTAPPAAPEVDPPAPPKPGE